MTSRTWGSAPKKQVRKGPPQGVGDGGIQKYQLYIRRLKFSKMMKAIETRKENTKC